MLRIALLAVVMLAQAEPEAAPSDPRIQSLAYDPDQIIPLAIGFGFASVIELADDERAENIVVGNSGAWQVTANRQGNRIVVKPLSESASTNMIVLTNSRRYMFMLYPGGGEGQTAFLVRFNYPATPGDEPAPIIVSHYRFRGDKTLFPQAMYNDGERTVVSWAKEAPLPAVFAMYAGSREQLVNGRMEGDDYVIEGRAPRYKFRLGDAEAIATRRTPGARR